MAAGSGSCLERRLCQGSAIDAKRLMLCSLISYRGGGRGTQDQPLNPTIGFYETLASLHPEHPHSFIRLDHEVPQFNVQY